MKAIELVADVDEQHRLHARVPTEIPAGQARVIVLLPGEDDAGGLWADGVASEWAAELSDSREDIYTLEDGQPAHAIRSDLPRALSLWRRTRDEAASGPVAHGDRRAGS